MIGPVHPSHWLISTQVCSAAWYAAQNPFSRVDVAGSTAEFRKMFDVWVRNSEPDYASRLNISYRPLAVLGDKPKTTEDWIKAWTIAATRDGRANGTRPTFVLATSIGSTGRYVFYPSKSHYWLTNITGTRVSQLGFVFEPVGVTIKKDIKSGTMRRPVTNITKTKLDECFGTSKAIEKDDDDDSDEELVFKYEKDQPAGEILKFVVNKYMEQYFPAGGRVA